MNKIFVSTIFNELDLLKTNSWENIDSILKKYDNAEKEHGLELKFSEFLKKLTFNEVSTKEIQDFLNTPYNTEKVSDYISIKKDDKEKCYIITNNKYDKIFDISRGLTLFDRLLFQLKTVTNGPIINLVTIYENFIRQLIHYDCLDGDYDIIKNENLSFNEITSLNYNEERIKNHVIKTYCDNKLYGDKKRITEIINTLKIDCSDCQDLINNFNEIYFRRNMYVHSINELTVDYLSLPPSLIKKWTRDNSLINTPAYFEHAFVTVNKVFLMILIKKYLFKKQSQSDLEIIASLVFEEIYSKGYYEVAKFGYEQFKKISWISKTERYMFFINYMNCLKKTKDSKLKTELTKWNTDTDANVYKLAKKLIENNYTGINELINKLFKSEEDFKIINEEERILFLNKDAIETWPLFEDYRKTDYYNELKKQLNF